MKLCETCNLRHESCRCCHTSYEDCVRMLEGRVFNQRCEFENEIYRLKNELENEKTKNEYLTERIAYNKKIVEDATKFLREGEK